MNSTNLGPKARRIVRFAARLLNPLVLVIAGRRWMPILGVLHHQGRQSGRAYATPLGMRPLGNAFFMPRTFGKNAAWYLNVKAAGWCVVTYKGRDYKLIGPEVVDYATAAPAFPRYELLQFRLVGINEYLRMTQAPHQFKADKEQSAMSQESIADKTSAPRNLGVALIVIAFAQLMVVLDTTIVNVALPSIQRALRFSSTDLEWVVNAYSLAFGGLLLLGGRAGDLFGRRRMFVGGVLLFAAGSFAGGLATSSTWLIIARVVQGAGAAVVAPTALSLIADTFKEGAARNRALGIYAGAAGSGGAIGLILGGLITNYVSWRWVMFVNVPIAVLLAVAAPRVLATSKGRSGRLDLPGAISVTGGMTLLVYGLSRAATHDWSDTITVATLGFGAALLVLFLIINRASQQATTDAVEPVRQSQPIRCLRPAYGRRCDDADGALLPHTDRPERPRLQPAQGRIRLPTPRRGRRHHGHGHLSSHRPDWPARADRFRRDRGRGRPAMAVAHRRSRHVRF